MFTNIRDGLVREYPLVGGIQSPKTHLLWEISEKLLIIHSLHTYPNEGRQVVSYTEFRLLQGASDVR